MDVIDWLFEGKPPGTKPQLGFAAANKQALLWLPGNHETSDSRIEQAMLLSSYRGATQLAFKSFKEPQHQQKNCWICWLGVDIDEDIDVKRIVCSLREFPISLRKSTGGNGVHVLVRLVRPIMTTTRLANALVKNLTKPMTKALDEAGQPWCKADRRMFWLMGGKHEPMISTEQAYHPNISAFEETEERPERPSITIVELRPEIQQWVEFLEIKEVVPHLPVYIKPIVEKLRACGEVVNTRSTMRGNGEQNGFLSLTPNSISLFANADGHTIWSDSIE